jgi:hypothetical protein
MRRYIRQSTNLPVDVCVPSTGIDATDETALRSLSQGGLSCQLPSAVAVGTIVRIEIDAVSPPYSGTGEIVWCQQSDQHFEVGVRFTDAEEAFKARMVQQVCQIEQYKKRVFEQQGRVLDSEQAAAEWIEQFAENFSPRS